MNNKYFSSYTYFLILLLLSVVVNSQRTLISLRTKLNRLKVSEGSEGDNNVDLGRDSSFFLIDWLIVLRKSYFADDEDETKWMLFLAMSIVFTICMILLGIVLIVNKYIMIQKEEESSEYLRIKEEDDEQNSKVELSFEDIQVVLQQKKKKGSRVLLDGSIRGTAHPGKLVAIVGPSGCGKTTLLEALAGQLPYSKNLKVYGKRYINGNDVAGILPQMAYIPQESNFFPYMTVRETLEFRANLISIKKKRKEEILQRVMDQMNLSHLAETIVGDGGKKVRGLSGGERKRLMIAIKMVCDNNNDIPSILLLDEPTSGLDSYQAKQVVATLRKMADESHKTIIAVIHQPSQQAFAQFDDVLVLSEGGKQIYFGPTKDVRKYLQQQSLSSSVDYKETGTAEYILDCVSKVNANGGLEEIESIQRIHELALKAKAQKIALKSSSDNGARKKRTRRRNKKKANWFRQFTLLFQRALRETLRGKTAILIKVAQQIVLGVIYGGIYKLDTNNQSSIQDRIGLLSLIAIGSMNMGMAGTIRSFPKEKSIVARETSSALYDTGPYFIAKAISETPLLGLLSSVFSVIVYSMAGLQRSKFPTFCVMMGLHTLASEAAGLFIGSVSSSSDIALALFPAVAVLNIIFDGKNISSENIPSFLKWLPNIGLVRWGFEGLTINEFQGLTFDQPNQKRRKRGPPSFGTGEEVLDRYGMANTSVLDVVKVQGVMILSFWFLSYLGLRLNRQKYMNMQQQQPEKEKSSKEKEE